MSLVIGSLIPSINSSTTWLAGDSKSADLSGSLCLIQFWAVSCPMCKRNFPKLQSLIDEYSMHGLQLLSIHMPRSESDMDVEKVKIAVQELGLIGPCAIDNDHAIGNLFQTGGAWPYYFLFDAEGKLRSRAAGSLGLKMAENSLKRLLELQETSNE